MRLIADSKRDLVLQEQGIAPWTEICAAHTTDHGVVEVAEGKQAVSIAVPGIVDFLIALLDHLGLILFLGRVSFEPCVSNPRLLTALL
jgi:hypothetical protein